MPLKMIDTADDVSSALGGDTAERLVASFVPELLRSEIESLTLSEKCDRFASFITKPHSRIVTGVCMIIDIVGFCTVMSQFIAHQDVHGITNIVKSLISKIVNLVYNSSGDVIELSGSTIVCLFQPIDQTVNSCRKSCIHAMSCAWELKDFSTVDLGIRVGITYGDMSIGLLGGNTNCWRFVVAGSCKKDMMTSLQGASVDQVLITRKCHVFLSGPGDLGDLVVDSNTHLLSGTDINYGAIEFLPSNPELFLVTVYKSKQSLGAKKAVGSFRFRTLIFTSGIRDANNPLPTTNSVEFISRVYSFVPLSVTRAVIAGSFDTISEVVPVTVLFIRMDDYEGRNDTHTLSTR